MSESYYNEIVEEFKRAGWIMGILAALGMLARLIFTNETFKVVIWGRKTFAASIVGIIVYFSMYQSGISDIYKSVICSISGSFAPELFEYVRKRILLKYFSND